MPELTPARLVAILELAHLGLAEMNHVNEAALSEDRRQAIVDLLQEREERQARIRDLERFIESRGLNP